MHPILLIAALGAAAAFLAKKSFAATTGEIPKQFAHETPVVRTVTAKSGNTYTVQLYPPDSTNTTFTVATLASLAAPVNTPPASIAFYQHKATGSRRFAWSNVQAGEATIEAVTKLMKTDFNLS